MIYLCKLEIFMGVLMKVLEDNPIYSPKAKDLS
jgi:hypothetical protein